MNPGVSPGFNEFHDLTHPARGPSVSQRGAYLLLLGDYFHPVLTETVIESFG